jgi:hypothetical protein
MRLGLVDPPEERRGVGEVEMRRRRSSRRTDCSIVRSMCMKQASSCAWSAMTGPSSVLGMPI